MLDTKNFSFYNAELAERGMRMKYILIVPLYIVMLPILFVVEFIGTLFLCAAIWLEALGMQMMAEDKQEVMDALSTIKDVLRNKYHALNLIVNTACLNRAKELGCLDEIVEDLENIKQQ